LSDLPLLDLEAATPAMLCTAVQDTGCLQLRDPAVSTARCAQALADAAAFFALPQAAKDALDIRSSPHFRGYSTMHNERDWREQIHFGREDAAAAGAPFWRLQGPNRWPADRAWRDRMEQYLAAVEQVGTRLLAKLAQGLGLPADAFAGHGAAYLLMKLICYHAQPAEQAPRQGVAAHLDFSLVTLTMQDDTGGLEVQRPDGRWVSVPPTPGAWLVTIGELLQYATRNAFLATPHRVVNPSRVRSRHSIPVFLNPALTATVVPLSVLPRPALEVARQPHVHYVLDQQRPPAVVPFGPAEWRRKGENVWCEPCFAARTGVTSLAAPSRG
jgi:isopenicillin N synthase-like dioxygenase